ncbi:hypothetical protein GWD52_10065 [Enterobacteriaceae bacterium 4M9]|nr:hypothetical protein [Enterobacteriaceae bacterium 4M9]
MDDIAMTVGGDPRGYSETETIREEMAKLSHPARPDVNWLRVEQSCQALFGKNGVDLRTAVFYTVARGHLAGLSGLNEGLGIVRTLISRHWAQMWPQQTHTRIELLSWLSGSVLQRLRALSLSYADLPVIYQAEKELAQLCSTLQLLELKQLSRLEPIQLWLQQAAATLEQVDETSAGVPVSATPTASASQDAPLPPLPETRVSEKPLRVPKKPVAQAADAARTSDAQDTQFERGTSATLKQSSAIAPRRNPGFLAGFFCALLLSAIAALIIWWLARPAPQQALLEQVAPVVTVDGVAEATRLKASLTTDELTQTREPWLKALDEKLALMATLPPLWKEQQGRELILAAQTLWPEAQAVAHIREREQQRREALAIPSKSLGDWHLAQQRLEALTQRLNALDERRGRWLTGSELKTAVFDIRQALDKTPPLEELLRQLEQQQAVGANTAALRKQIDDRFAQLLNRYALLDEQLRLPAKTSLD